MKTKILYTIFFAILCFQWSCTEPFEIESKGYENVLVVESTITDEMKSQTVKLSRTSTLDSAAVLTERGASVNVLGSNGENFSFSQDDNTGNYISDREFSAQPMVSYTLEIKTQDGRSYTSAAVNLPPAVALGEVYTDRIVDPNQSKDGVQILVNTEDPTGNAKYFRYEYEETYKVVAPNPSPFTVEIVNYVANPLSYDLELTPREPEEICYSTEISTGINQIATTDLNENKVFRFPVRYLSKDDARIQTRYSILVKQYVQSVEAYTFYKIIRELGSVGSLLSQGQPGYVTGNITSDSNADEKVLGFFEVSTMTSKRIYFNYEDVGLQKPPYFIDCEILRLDYNMNSAMDGINERRALINYIKYFDYQVITGSSSGVYRIVQPECSVCTSISSNIRPDFWQD